MKLSQQDFKDIYNILRKIGPHAEDCFRYFLKASPYPLKEATLGEYNQEMESLKSGEYLKKIIQEVDIFEMFPSAITVMGETKMTLADYFLSEAKLSQNKKLFMHFAQKDLFGEVITWTLNRFKNHVTQKERLKYIPELKLLNNNVLMCLNIATDFAKKGLLSNKAVEIIQSNLACISTYNSFNKTIVDKYILNFIDTFWNKSPADNMYLISAYAQYIEKNETINESALKLVQSIKQKISFDEIKYYLSPSAESRYHVLGKDAEKYIETTGIQVVIDPHVIASDIGVSFKIVWENFRILSHNLSNILKENENFLNVSFEQQFNNEPLKATFAFINNEMAQKNKDLAKNIIHTVLHIPRYQTGTDIENMIKPLLMKNTLDKALQEKHTKASPRKI